MDWSPIPGPFRAFRDRYVASFGGVSYDLAPRIVGVHPEHLARVPELVGKEVLVSHDTSKPTSLARRPAFRVVALDRMMRDALGIASRGVVFSVFDLDDPLAGRLLGEMDVGASVFLNSAVERLPGDIVRRPGDLSAA